MKEHVWWIAAGVTAVISLVIIFYESVSHIAGRIVMLALIAMCYIISIPFEIIGGVAYYIPIGSMKIEPIVEEDNIFHIVKFRDNKEGMKIIVDKVQQCDSASGFAVVYRNGDLRTDIDYDSDYWRKNVFVPENPAPWITSGDVFFGRKVDYRGYFAETGGNSRLYAFKTYSDKLAYDYYWEGPPDTTKVTMWFDGKPVYGRPIHKNLVWTFSPSFPESCGYKFTITNAPPEATVTLDYWRFDTDVLQKFLNVVFYYHQQPEYADTKRFVLSSGDCEVVYDGEFFKIDIR